MSGKVTFDGAPERGTIRLGTKLEAMREAVGAGNLEELVRLAHQQIDRLRRHRLHHAHIAARICGDDERLARLQARRQVEVCQAHSQRGAHWAAGSCWPGPARRWRSPAS